MKYDLEKTILDIKGEVAEQKYSEDVFDEKGNKTQKLSSAPLTLGKAITDSILFQVENDDINEKNYLLRYGIYEKVLSGDSDFNKEELEIIKKCIVKRYVVLYAGQFLRMLNK